MFIMSLQNSTIKKSSSMINNSGIKSGLLIILGFVCGLLPLSAIENSALKADLIKKWPKANAIISHYNTRIEFAIDDETKQPIVIQTDEMDIIPAKASYLSRTFLYDDYSNINKASILKNGTTKIRVTPTHGDCMSDEIFHSDAKFYHYEFSTSTDADFYRVTSVKQINDLHYLNVFFFNDTDYPIVNRSVTIDVPNWLELKVHEFNFNYFMLNKAINSLNNSTQYVYQINDIPQTKKDYYYLSPQHSFPHLMFHVKKYTNTQNIDIPIFIDLHGYYTWIQQLYSDLKPNIEVIKPRVSQILNNCPSRIDSIKAIYYWVQDNIRYIAFEDGLGGLVPEQADKVYTNKYGDCKGMANLLKTMLQIAGFDSRLAWMGTTHLIYDYSIPNIAVGNHMICYLQDANNEYFLDATQKMQQLGVNSDLIQGKQVLIENSDSYLLRTIPLEPATTNATRVSVLLNLNQTELDGKIEMAFDGQMKFAILNHLSQIASPDKDKFIRQELLESKSTTISDSINYNDIKQRESTFRVQAGIKVTNQVINSDQDYFLNLGFLSTNNDEKIDTTNIYHLDLKMKSFSDITIEVNLPQDVQVKQLPKNENFEVGPFSYTTNYQYINNSILYHKTITINKAVIDKSEFKAYFEFMTNYRKATKQSIHLQKS